MTISGQFVVVGVPRPAVLQLMKLDDFSSASLPPAPVALLDVVLAGIRAPALDEPCGYDSREAVRRRFLHAKVSLCPTRMWRGVQVAAVRNVATGEDAAVMLVAAGLAIPAHARETDEDYAATLAEAAERAVRKGAGMHSIAYAMRSSEFIRVPPPPPSSSSESPNDAAVIAAMLVGASHPHRGVVEQVLGPNTLLCVLQPSLQAVLITLCGVRPLPTPQRAALERATGRSSKDLVSLAAMRCVLHRTVTFVAEAVGGRGELFVTLQDDGGYATTLFHWGLVLIDHSTLPYCRNLQDLVRASATATASSPTTLTHIASDGVEASSDADVAAVVAEAAPFAARVLWVRSANELVVAPVSSMSGRKTLRVSLAFVGGGQLVEEEERASGYVVQRMNSDLWRLRETLRKSAVGRDVFIVPLVPPGRFGGERAGTAIVARVFRIRDDLHGPVSDVGCDVDLNVAQIYAGAALVSLSTKNGFTIPPTDLLVSVAAAAAARVAKDSPSSSSSSLPPPPPTPKHVVSVFLEGQSALQTFGDRLPPLGTRLRCVVEEIRPPYDMGIRLIDFPLRIRVRLRGIRHSAPFLAPSAVPSGGESDVHIFCSSVPGEKIEPPRALLHHLLVQELVTVALQRDVTVVLHAPLVEPSREGSDSLSTAEAAPEIVFLCSIFVSDFHGEGAAEDGVEVKQQYHQMEEELSMRLIREGHGVLAGALDEVPMGFVDDAMAAQQAAAQRRHGLWDPAVGGPEHFAALREARLQRTGFTPCGPGALEEVVRVTAVDAQTGTILVAACNDGVDEPECDHEMLQCAITSVLNTLLEAPQTPQEELRELLCAEKHATEMRGESSTSNRAPRLRRRECRDNGKSKGKGTSRSDDKAAAPRTKSTLLVLAKPPEDRPPDQWRRVRLLSEEPCAGAAAISLNPNSGSSGRNTAPSGKIVRGRRDRAEAPKASEAAEAWFRVFFLDYGVTDILPSSRLYTFPVASEAGRGHTSPQFSFIHRFPPLVRSVAPAFVTHSSGDDEHLSHELHRFLVQQLEGQTFVFQPRYTRRGVTGDVLCGEFALHSVVEPFSGPTTLSALLLHLFPPSLVQLDERAAEFLEFLPSLLALASIPRRVILDRLSYDGDGDGDGHVPPHCNAPGAFVESIEEDLFRDAATGEAAAVAVANSPPPSFYRQLTPPPPPTATSQQPSGSIHGPDALPRASAVSSRSVEDRPGRPRARRATAGEYDKRALKKRSWPKKRASADGGINRADEDRL